MFHHLRIAACLLATLSFLSAPITASTHTSTSITEKIEWTWSDRPSAPDPALPNILLVGDSITRSYFPEVEHLLASHANVYLFATSASSGDPRLPRQIEEYLADSHLSFSVIHFNNGIHGWGYNETLFADGLPGLYQALHSSQPKAKLVWASITPVRDDNPQGATNSRINARNLAASALMQRLHIPIDDQYALMLSHQDQHADTVHFTEAGSKIQAEQVVASIAALLPAK
jgi:hypothetical protein